MSEKQEWPWKNWEKPLRNWDMMIFQFCLVSWEKDVVAVINNLFCSGQTLKKIAEFQRDYDDLRSNMESAFKEGVMKPLDTFRADLKEFSVRAPFSPHCSEKLGLTVCRRHTERKERIREGESQLHKRPSKDPKSEETCWGSARRTDMQRGLAKDWERCARQSHYNHEKWPTG